LFVIETFLIEFEEAIEFDDGACGTERIGLAVLALDANVGSCALDLGALHLARNRALPDEFIQRLLIAIELTPDVFRETEQIGRPDRFMGFLRVLRLRRVFARNGRE